MNQPFFLGKQMSKSEKLEKTKGKQMRSSVFHWIFRGYFYEFLCLLLLTLSMVFFWYAISLVASRDYPGSLLLLGAGLSIAHLGGLMARLALADRS